MSVGIVTDSTAYLPDPEALGIDVVPVQVVIDGTAHDEVDGVTTAQLADALRAGAVVTTSRPTAAAFEEVYRQLHERGHDSIISIHLSGRLSGTAESAQIAAARMPFPVIVIDSHQIAMAFGFAVQRAAQAALAGADLESIAAAVRTDCDRASIAFSVDTLEFLQRGGRIGSAQARLGGVLQVKPILHMKDGQVTDREMVRTTSKSMARLVEIAAEQISGDQISGPVDVAVHHVDAQGRAWQLAALLHNELGLSGIVVTECGAVVAAHVGPGALAVVVSPR